MNRMKWWRINGIFCCCFFGVFLGECIAESGVTLGDAVQLALEHNPEISIAREQCVQGQGIYTQAKSGYLPRLTAAGDYGQYNIKDLVPEDEDTVAHAGVSLTQLIYDFGKTTGTIDAGQFSLEAADAHLDQTFQDVVLDTREAFYSVLEKQRLVEVAKEAIANYEQHLYRAKKYYKAGVRTKIDVTNAEVNLSSTKLDLVHAESNLAAARTSLEKILGEKPNNGEYFLKTNESSLDKLAATKPALSVSLDSLLLTAFEHRADMRQVTFLAKATKANIAKARSGYLPSIAAQASYDTYETDLSSFYDQWNVVLGVSWDIFSGFQTEGKVIEAKARHRELMASLNDLKLAITDQVTRRYLRAEENRKAVDLADEALGLALENLDLAEGRYKAGLNDLLEYNDAQLRLTEAQSNLVTTYYGYLTALARSEAASGVTKGLVGPKTGGWCTPMTWNGGEND